MIYDAQKILMEYKLTKERLLAQYPELEFDNDALADTLEGCTNLIEAIEKLLLDAEEKKQYAACIAEMIKNNQARKKRYEASSDSLRKFAKELMQQAGLPRIKTPALTASISKPQTVLELDESACFDDKYMVIVKTPSKTLIKAALEGGEEIEGARLVDGEPSLRVSMK
jgi:hypothetical protein